MSHLPVETNGAAGPAPIEAKVREFYQLSQKNKANKASTAASGVSAKRKKELGNDIRDFMLSKKAEAIRVGKAEAILLVRTERKSAFDAALIMEVAAEFLGDSDKAAHLVRAIETKRQVKVSHTVRLGKAPRNLISIRADAAGGDEDEDEDEDGEVSWRTRTR